MPTADPAPSTVDVGRPDGDGGAAEPVAEDIGPTRSDDGVVADAHTSFAPTPTPKPGAVGGIWTLFAGLGLLMVGNGLNGAVIGIRSNTEGFSFVVTGVIMAGYFGGFLLAPSVIVQMIARVGHIRVFAGLASTASSAVLVHAISVTPVTWTLMRFVFGFCMAGLYIVVESWLAAMSTEANRGRILAVYMIVSMGGLGIGQFLTAFADPNGFELLVVASVLVSVALVPVTLAATTRAPQVTLPEPISIRELIRIVPSGVLASFVAGLAVGIVFGLGAAYASAIGLSRPRTGFFLVAPTIGAILFQYPIGRLSDRVSRRVVIFGVALIGSAVSALLMVLPQQIVAVPALMIVLGGMLFPLYSLAITYTLDWTPENQMVGASGTLIRINGSGALLGPLIAAPLMSSFGSRWFFWTLSIAFGILVVYLAWRIVAKEGLPVRQQRDFVPFPARAGSIALNLVVGTARRAASSRSSREVNITSRRHPHAGTDAVESGHVAAGDTLVAEADATAGRDGDADVADGPATS